MMSSIASFKLTSLCGISLLTLNDKPKVSVLFLIALNAFLEVPLEIL